MNLGGKIIRILGLLTVIGLAHCGEPISTEYQARTHDIENVQEVFSLGKVFEPIQYQVFDKDNLLTSNHIVARYRDMGKKVDFNLKFRFAYDAEMLTVLTACFVGQKVEVNRYSDKPDELIELVFKEEVKKEDIGLKKKQALTEQQIKQKFFGMYYDLKLRIAKLKADNPDFADFAETLQPEMKQHLNTVSEKINLFAQTNPYSWQRVKTYQRDKWVIQDWKSYPPIEIEVMRIADQPQTEISVRLEGDIKDSTFFDDLRSSGLRI